MTPAANVNMNQGPPIQTTCPCETPGCPGDGGGYYVSLVRDRRTSLLLGPYDTHAQAMDQRDRGRTLAYEADAWSWFDPVGTVRLNPEADLPRSVFGT